MDEQAADLLEARRRFDAEGQRLAESVSWTPRPPKGPKPPKARLVAAVARIDGQWKEWR